MTPGRTPWWFSGDETGDRPAEAAAESSPSPPPEDMAPPDSEAPDDVAPDDVAPDEDVAPDGTEAPASSAVDWLGMLSGAPRGMDWATERVMAPHAEHVDPNDHPQCVICRTMVVIGDRLTFDEGPEEAAADDSTTPAAPPMPAAEPLVAEPAADAPGAAEAYLDEGYEPPAPPPIPRPSDAIGHFSWAAVVAGPLLVITANLLAWDRWMSGLGVVITVGGFVSLVARMKDERDDDDNGAVV